MISKPTVADTLRGACRGLVTAPIHKGVLYTPDVANGALKGITRQAILDLCAERGLKVIEKDLTRYDVWVSEECFLTGTAAEVTPIRSVDRIVVGAGKAGEITLALQARLLDVAQGRVPDPYGWLTPVQQRKEVPVG